MSILKSKRKDAEADESSKPTYFGDSLVLNGPSLAAMKAAAEKPTAKGKSSLEPQLSAVSYEN